MYIETKNLIVRDFSTNDIDALYNIAYDKAVLEYIPNLLKRNVQKDEIKGFIETFNKLEAEGNINDWRMYAIVLKENSEVIGSLSFGKNEMLFEYELGWQMIGRYTRHGYASEAASAYAEYFCEKNKVEYLVAMMDLDNPASYRTAVKSGFKLFEKRTVYDYSCNRYCDDFYYLRRYYSKSTLTKKFYGDVVYDGRHS